MNHHVAEEEKEHTHVLIIGNGFDIEHGLKTDYLSFLKYLEEKDKSREKKESESNLWYGHFLHLLELNRSEKALWSGLEQEIGEAIVELNKLIGELERIKKRSIDVPEKELVEWINNPLLPIETFPFIQKQFEELRAQLSTIIINRDDKFCKLIECFREKVYKIYKTYLKDKLWKILEKIRRNMENQVKEQECEAVSVLEISNRVEIELEQLKEDLIKCSFYDLLCVSQELVKYIGKEVEKVIETEEKSELQKACQGKVKLMVLDFNYIRLFEQSYVPEKDQLKLKKSKFKLDRVLSDMNLSGPIKICYIHGNTLSKSEMIKSNANMEYDRCRKLANGNDISSSDIPEIAIVFGCSKFKEEDSIDKLFDCYTKDNQRKKEEDVKQQEEIGKSPLMYTVYCGGKGFHQYSKQQTAGENYKTITYKDFSDELKESQNITFHIIGHSLGEIDHDILREVLGFQNSRIRVYYHNKEAHCRLKKNIIKIIGKEDVKKRVEFIYQYDPQEGVFPSDALNIG